MLEFASFAGGNTNNTEAKIGYSLAAVASGDLPRAAWAMKRALHIDTNAVEYVRANPLAQSALNRLSTQLAQARSTNPNDLDVDYLLVAMSNSSVNNIADENMAGKEAMGSQDHMSAKQPMKESMLPKETMMEQAPPPPTVVEIAPVDPPTPTNL